MSTHDPKEVSTSRQTHRLGYDADGNKYLATVMSNEKAGTVSIRIWSMDGNVLEGQRHCHYFPAGPAADMPVTTLAKSVGIALEMEEYTLITGDSTEWANLKFMRKLKEVSSKSIKTDKGWVNETTYQHCWFSWKHTCVSVPCATKSIANDKGAWAAFDEAFPKCSRLLAESTESKRSKKIICWD